MRRTTIAPVLGALLEDLRTTDKHRKPLPGDAAILRIAGEELRNLRAVASAAERDPDKHWRVEAALARLRRASSPSKAPVRSPGRIHLVRLITAAGEAYRIPGLATLNGAFDALDKADGADLSPSKAKPRGRRTDARRGR